MKKRFNLALSILFLMQNSFAYESSNASTTLHAQTGKCNSSVNQSADFSIHTINDHKDRKEYIMYYHLCMNDEYHCIFQMLEYTLNPGESYNDTRTLSGLLKFPKGYKKVFIYSNVYELDKKVIARDNQYVNCS